MKKTVTTRLVFKYTEDEHMLRDVVPSDELLLISECEVFSERLADSKPRIFW